MNDVLSVSLLALFALRAAILVDAADVIAFTIPSTVLANASQILDPRFAGFGIEFSNIFSFTGTAESPNTFSANLLQNLKAVAGVGPCIRVGGNTQDNALYQVNYTAAEIGRNQYPTLHPDVTGYVPFDNDVYGPELFKALGVFPAGTQFIYGLNLAYDNSDYLDVITNTAEAVLSALDGNIYSFEIGNEPDLYDSTSPYRIGQNWSGAAYVEEWVTRSAAIQLQVSIFVYCKPKFQVLAQAGRQKNFFEAGTTASTIGTSFEIKMLAADNIDRDDTVFHYNQHDYFYYIKVSDYTITRQYMMNHGNIVSQFTAWATQQQQSVAAGKPYLLGEMAAIGPQGLAEITDVFGCALWTLDFFLYTATINVTHVLMHMTDIGNQSAWQPITIGNIAPWVRPAYYGHIIMSTLIGPNNDTTIAEIDIRSQQLQDYAGRASSYVVYRGNQIYATVLINLKEFNQSMTATTDTALNFTINIPPEYAGSNLTVLKLSAPGADSFKEVTWAGINFQTDDGLPAGAPTNDTTFTTVSSEGTFSVLVRDTQAVVVVFDSSSGVILELPTSTDPGTLSSSAVSLSSSSATSSSSADSSGTDGGASKSAGRRMYEMGSVCIMILVNICMAMIVF